MVITPELEYPMVCVGVKQNYSDGQLKLELINMNQKSKWYHSSELEEMDGMATVVPRRESLPVTKVHQLDESAVLVSFESSYLLCLFVCFISGNIPRKLLNVCSEA